MIIYRADFFFNDINYNQKEFLKNLENNFKFFGDSLHTTDQYGTCSMFDSIDDALDDAEIFGAVGVKISEFVLTEDQCKELLINQSLKITPEKISYYSYSDETEALEEFQLKPSYET